LRQELDESTPSELPQHERPQQAGFEGSAPLLTTTKLDCSFCLFENTECIFWMNDETHLAPASYQYLTAELVFRASSFL
jgi:hypothetical protein